MKSWDMAVKELLSLSEYNFTFLNFITFKDE